MIEWMKEILGDSYTEDIDSKIAAKLAADYAPKADLDAANQAKADAEAALAALTAANDKYKEQSMKLQSGDVRLAFFMAAILTCRAPSPVVAQAAGFGQVRQQPYFFLRKIPLFYKSMLYCL